MNGTPMKKGRKRRKRSCAMKEKNIICKIEQNQYTVLGMSNLLVMLNVSNSALKVLRARSDKNSLKNTGIWVILINNENILLINNTMKLEPKYRNVRVGGKIPQPRENNRTFYMFKNNNKVRV